MAVITESIFEIQAMHLRTWYISPNTEKKEYSKMRTKKATLRLVSVCRFFFGA